MHLTTFDRLISVPDGSVFVRIWQHPKDQDSFENPLILLHDSLGSVELWRGFPEKLALALNCSVIAYDRLGFGKSTARTELPSPDFIREEAEIYFPAIAQELKLQQFTLFGHSVGGAMALLIAGEYPRQCQAVITESAQAFVEDRTKLGISKAKANFSHPEQLARLEKYHKEQTQWVLRAWTEVWLSKAFENWSLEKDLAKVQCPVLILHGDQDEFGSHHFPDRIAGWLTASCLVDRHLLSDTGHVPHRERESDILALTSKFLTSLK